MRGRDSAAHALSVNTLVTDTVLRSIRTTATTEAHFKSHEHATRNFLTPGMYGVLRLDGRSFGSYCRGLLEPADELFIAHMDMVAVELVKQLSGVRLAYVQSDEISLLLTDWASPTMAGDAQSKTEFMFGGNIQKLASISAAIASTAMNIQRLGTVTDKVALFDARAFSLSSRQDAIDYFAWRQHDAQSNTLSMTASARFSHKQLDGVGAAGKRRMLLEAGIDPDGTPLGFRRGRAVVFEARPGSSTFVDRRTQKETTVEFVRQTPVAVPAPLFTTDGSLIPLPRMVSA
jgi:tRNA(His) guanylyltransferase